MHYYGIRLVALFVHVNERHQCTLHVLTAIRGLSVYLSVILIR